MKHLHLFIVAALLAFLTACSTLGVPAPQTLTQRLAVATSSATAAVGTASTLLAAKKISPSDAENIARQADNVIAGVQIARALAPVDPAAADAKLQQSLAVLSALNAYLLAKEQGK